MTVERNIGEITAVRTTRSHARMQRILLFWATPCLLGVLCLIVIPAIHMGITNKYVFDNSEKVIVDRLNCENTCWDTKFKGSYETFPGRYKHVYFNSNEGTLKIWTVTVISMFALYETVKRIAVLLFNSKLRYSMLVLFITVFHSHYYTWWMLFNYINDDFYNEWYHQLFFSFTELISTFCVVYLMNKENDIHPCLLVIIINIAIFHIILSLGDQFINNIFFHQGRLYQIVRDLCFILPDVCHVIIPGFLLFKMFKITMKSDSRYTGLRYDKGTCKHIKFYTIGSFVMVLTLSLVGTMIQF